MKIYTLLAVGLILCGCLPDSQPDEVVLQETTPTGSGGHLSESAPETTFSYDFADTFTCYRTISQGGWVIDNRRWPKLDGKCYPLSANMAVADFKAAYAAAVEVDSTATLLALVGLIQRHGLPVAPFGYGREMWRWPLAECGAFAVKYRVHYEADFIVDLPEFAVWADTTRMIGSSLQVAGIDTSWNMGGFSVPGVTGAGVLESYPLAEPCR